MPFLEELLVLHVHLRRHSPLRALHLLAVVPVVVQSEPVAVVRLLSVVPGVVRVRVVPGASASLRHMLLPKATI